MGDGEIYVLCPKESCALHASLPQSRPLQFRRQAKKQENINEVTRWNGYNYLILFYYSSRYILRFAHGDLKRCFIIWPHFLIAEYIFLNIEKVGYSLTWIKLIGESIFWYMLILDRKYWPNLHQLKLIFLGWSPNCVSIETLRPCKGGCKRWLVSKKRSPVCELDIR